MSLTWSYLISLSSLALLRAERCACKILDMGQMLRQVCTTREPGCSFSNILYINLITFLSLS